MIVTKCVIQVFQLKKAEVIVGLEAIVLMMWHMTNGNFVRNLTAYTFLS